jgi:SAM-dependent methyltransferase
MPWYQANDVGWQPRCYEWYFQHVPLGAAIRARETAAVHALVAPVIGAEQHVLEVGPGTGHYTTWLAARCRRVTAVDASPEMLRYLVTRLQRAGITNVEVRCGRLPGPLELDGPYDGVLAVGVLNYVDDLDAALGTLVAALCPGGWAVLTVPARSLEGRIYQLTEVLGRRRIRLYTVDEARDRFQRAGIAVDWAEAVGLSRGGVTLVLGGRRVGGLAAERGGVQA